MERAEWLKHMRSKAEVMYDRFSPQYWVKFGFYENETHMAYLQKFLARVTPGGRLLSAGCGAGRYDGFLLEAGHPVVGTDQSAGMLKRAQEKFPQITYQKTALQDMDFQAEFAGVICMDTMEHISPEDYPGILRNFQAALQPGGWLYFSAVTQDTAEPGELEGAFERARARGLPVIFGEVADRVDDTCQRTEALGDQPPAEAQDTDVYHYYPPLETLHAWLEQAGLELVEEGVGSSYRHVLATKLPSR